MEKENESGGEMHGQLPQENDIRRQKQWTRN